MSKKYTNTGRQVYALIDPRSPAVIRYVGCSQCVPMRVGQHIGGSLHPRRRFQPIETEAKNAWIRGLISAGVRPIAIVLENVAPGENWRAREEHWIAIWRTPALMNGPRFRPQLPATPKPVMRGYEERADG